jgi:hypothetical protein
LFELLSTSAIGTGAAATHLLTLTLMIQEALARPNVYV